MTGRYCLQGPKGSLLFTIARREGKPIIEVELLEQSIRLAPDKVLEEAGRLVLLSSIIFLPNQVFRAELQPDGEGYACTGSYAGYGEIEGKAMPFTGKTKWEQMLEELPAYRTGKKKSRTEEEIQKEVEKLLGRMTLEEKIGQMSQAATGAGTAAIGSEVGGIPPLEEALKRGMYGSVIAMCSPEQIFYYQKLAVEHSRLGIPLMCCLDVIHGFDTVFPIPLAWACSFSPELVERGGRVAAKEATSTGIMYAFAPMLDIARDPRWGRVSEGNGEDPYLCSRMAEALVRGYQGTDLGNEDSMIACLKHFIGYSAAEGGRDYNTCEITETTLRNVYLPPFTAGVKAGAGSVMNSFNTMNSVPVAVNKRILRDLLRDEMGFEGILVSDYAAIEEVLNHGAAEDGADAAAKAVRASMDIEMVTTLYNTHLARLVRGGQLEEELLDESVRRILTYKFKTGLMDDPYKFLRPADMERIFCEEHRRESLALARESMVLLKNNGALPLEKGKTVAVIGPKGDSTDLLGPWQFSKKKAQTVTLCQGLRSKGFALLEEEGSGISQPVEGGLERAVAAARQADAVVLALGESADMSGEAASRQSIDVPAAQMELAKAVRAAVPEKPVILVLTNGRPLILGWFEENADAVLETWFLGSQAGEAIADVLAGDYNPSGRLAISFPRHQGQIPLYYNHLSTGRPYKEGMTDKFLSRYLDGPNTPLYPFGYGLSYTTFRTDNLALSAAEMKQGESMEVTVEVTNTGSRGGVHTVQLYIQDAAASIARPVKELKGFCKVALEAGETKTVTFSITEESLAFCNADNRWVVEPGRFLVMAGSSSDDRDLQTLAFTYR